MVSPAKKPNTSLIRGDAATLPSVGDWQANMRQAFMEAVTADDMREIAGAIVTRAKKGELGAIDLLCRYVLGDPKVVVQNAVIASAPTGARPGTDDKLRVMQMRVERGLPLASAGDAGFSDGADLT